MALLIAGLIGGLMETRQRHLRSAAKEGLRREIRENYDGLQKMRAGIPTDIENVSNTVALLEQRETGHAVDGSQAKLGLAVMALTDANWQAASVTGALPTMDYNIVETVCWSLF
jgi:ribosomal protein S2